MNGGYMDLHRGAESRRPGDKFGKAEARNRLLVTLGGTAVLLILLGVVFFLFVGISRVDGSSMYPTYNSGDIVWFRRGGEDFARGTVVSLNMPGGDRYIKRVVAVPGDTVDIKDGRLFVNGRAVREPYANGVTEADPEGFVTYPCKLSKNKYFVLGDNRRKSVDSRSFGPVASAQIQGRILGQH